MALDISRNQKFCISLNNDERCQLKEFSFKIKGNKYKVTPLVKQTLDVDNLWYQTNVLKLKGADCRKIKQQEKFNKLDLENKIKKLETQLSNWQTSNKDLKLDMEALSFLSSREFAQVKQEVERLKVDVVKKEDLRGRNTQSTKDKLNSLKVNCERQIKQIEDRAKSTQEKLDGRLAKIENVLKQLKIESNNTISRKNKPKPVSISPKTLIFIDQANFHHLCHELNIEPDYRSLKAKLMPERGKMEIRIYIGVFENPSQSQKALIKELNSLGYRVIEMPIQQRKDSTYKLVGDDVKLSCDLLEMTMSKEITSIDKVILVTGDGDYFPALEKVQKQGIHVTLVAYHPSQHLEKFYDSFLNLNLIKYDICQYKKLDSVA